MLYSVFNVQNIYVKHLFTGDSTLRLIGVGYFSFRTVSPVFLRVLLYSSAANTVLIIIQQILPDSHPLSVKKLEIICRMFNRLVLLDTYILHV